MLGGKNSHAVHVTARTLDSEGPKKITLTLYQNWNPIGQKQILHKNIHTTASWTAKIHAWKVDNGLLKISNNFLSVENIGHCSR